MRDHDKLLIKDFNGLWKRGDAESCPQDHFSDCNNIQFIQSGFRTRDGINPYLAFRNIRRMYAFSRQYTHGVLALDTDGNILHSESPTPFLPILTVVGMTDFAFVAIGDRAYISPHNGINGLDGEFVYVYLGNGLPARKIAGLPPVGTIIATNNGTTGHVEAGVHGFGVVYETDTGFLTSPGALTSLVAIGGQRVDLVAIPIPSSATVIRKHIVATAKINQAVYTGNPAQYPYYFVPGAVLTPAMTAIDISFYDSELIDSADQLFDLRTEVPAGIGLTTYNNRLVVINSFGEGDTVGNISSALVSNIGEPEAFSAIDGIIVTPIDGYPLTNAQEYRGLLYLFKNIRTYSYTDNGDVPSSWPLTIIDQGLGCAVHGIATVLDSGGINIEYLIIMNWSGIYLFQGLYIKPELSWKIKDFWLAIDREEINALQVVNNAIKQELWITLPDRKMLLADYANGMDFKNVRFSPESFRIKTSTITLVHTDILLIGSDSAFEG